MSDAVEEGLHKTEAELEELAVRLGASRTASDHPPTPPSLLDSPMAGDLGRLLVDAVAEGVRSFASRPRAPSRSRFTSPTPRTPPVPASIPAPVVAPAPAPSPITSIEVVPRPSPLRHDLSVEHVEDWDQPDRLDLTHAEPNNPRPLRGPVVGRQE